MHEHLLRALGRVNACIELSDLPLGHLTQAAMPLVPSGEQLCDLSQREAGILIEADQRDPLCARCLVVPFPAGTRR
jgi:hypothetical protein